MPHTVTVITGASGILGQALVEAALARGDHVVGIDFGTIQRPDSGSFIGLSGVDLTLADAAQNAMDTATSHFGHIDNLLNAVGGFVWQMTDGPLDSWERMHRMNLVTVLNACRAALPHLRAQLQGSIVNVGALGAMNAGAGLGAYAASKAGVHKLTEALAEECKSSGLRINAVLPSIIDTPANRTDMPDADFRSWVQPAQLATVM
ncbi:SDR family NAD(P)-dependent oxidoreductase, partial [Brevundimonas sp.]